MCAAWAFLQTCHRSRPNAMPALTCLILRLDHYRRDEARRICGQLRQAAGELPSARTRLSLQFDFSHGDGGHCDPGRLCCLHMPSARLKQGTDCRERPFYARLCKSITMFIPSTALFKSALALVKSNPDFRNSRAASIILSRSGATFQNLPCI